MSKGLSCLFLITHSEHPVKLYGFRRSFIVYEFQQKNLVRRRQRPTLGSKEGDALHTYTIAVRKVYN